MSIDWAELSIDPHITALAALIRREWRVWVGLLDQQGQLTSLAAASAPIEHPLCACFMANPLRGGDASGALRSCERSAREWAQAPAQRAVDGAHTCHAGLSQAQRVILDPRTGEPIARLFASGFIAEGSAQRSMVTIRRALAQTSLEDDAPFATQALERTPRHALPELLALDRLLDLLAEAIQEAVTRRLAVAAAAAPDRAARFCGMIGVSPSMQRLFLLIERVASTSSTVLILGENGTGKELVARALHQLSRRRDRPYVAQNCAAISSDLIESELFGHKRGAFSGAHRDRQGLFEFAHMGTFFLDEIGEMELNLQTKLLRVVQEGTFLPVGDSAYRKVDVRMICATNRDLQQLVRQGQFREDLFFRVNVITLQIPPLRERVQDIAPLAEHFLVRASRTHGLPRKRLSEACLAALMAYTWPGNVRELENEIERAVILTGEQTLIERDALSSRVCAVPQVDSAPPRFPKMNLSLPEAVEQLERHMILESLERHDGNKTQVARELGISRRNLIRKVARYAFGADDDSEGDEEDEALDAQR